VGGELRSSGGAGNLFADIPDELHEELFGQLLQRPGCRLERIVSHGHATPEGQWYDQAGEEWVLLLKGAAALEIEGHKTLLELHPGDYLLLSAHQRHRVAWTNTTGETIWLALHLDAEVPVEQPPHD
jgi:cupin 2 domain-containing protein